MAKAKAKKEVEEEVKDKTSEEVEEDYLFFFIGSIHCNSSMKT